MSQAFTRTCSTGSGEVREESLLWLCHKGVITSGDCLPGGCIYTARPRGTPPDRATSRFGVQGTSRAAAACIRAIMICSEAISSTGDSVELGSLRARRRPCAEAADSRRVCTRGLTSFSIPLGTGDTCAWRALACMLSDVGTESPLRLTD